MVALHEVPSKFHSLPDIIIQIMEYLDCVDQHISHTKFGKGLASFVKVVSVDDSEKTEKSPKYY